MPEVKHIQKIRDYIKKTPVFSSKDIERIVGKKNYAHLILHNLEKKKEVKRLSKGYYSVFSDPIYFVFCLKPAYLGLYEVLSLLNLWEQETIPVIITTKKVRTGKRQILNSNIIVKRIKPKYFFGIDYIKYGNFYLPISDLEKTLIDFYYFKEFFPFKRIKNLKIDKQKLLNYLKRYPKTFQMNFLKFLKRK